MVWLASLGMMRTGHAAILHVAEQAQLEAALNAPVEIPEPVTIVLFGTGLAAMAAAATVKRRK